MFLYLKILKINLTNYEEVLNTLITDVDNFFIRHRPTVSKNGTLLSGVDLTSGIKFNVEVYSDDDRLYVYAQNKHDLITVSKTISKVLGI